jgi:hypothetical protein
MPVGETRGEGSDLGVDVEIGAYARRTLRVNPSAS